MFSRIFQRSLDRYIVLFPGNWWNDICSRSSSSLQGFKGSVTPWTRSECQIKSAGKNVRTLIWRKILWDPDYKLHCFGPLGTKFNKHLKWLWGLDVASWCFSISWGVGNVGEARRKAAPGKDGSVGGGGLRAAVAISITPMRSSGNRYHLRLRWKHERTFHVDMQDTPGDPETVAEALASNCGKEGKNGQRHCQHQQKIFPYRILK